MKQFLSFVRKEFIHIFRDSRSLLILLAMPLVMVVLLGDVIKNEVTDIRVAIIDQSHDIYTSQITERFAANKYFTYMGEVQTEADAETLFRKGDIDLVVVFGSEFANRILHSQDATIQILSDGSEPNQGSVRVAYAQQVIASFQKELLQQNFSRLGVGEEAGSFNIKVNSRMLFNPQQRSEVNFVPGVVGLIMLLICCMMTSIAIVREREMGTMEILLASPLPAIYIVLAKLVPYMVISLFNLATILCITNFMMDVPMVGSLATYLLTSFIYIFTSLMLGLLISTCVNTQLAAMLISLLLIVPAIYLSGMVFPIESMPAPAQVVSNIVPTKWFISASRKIMIQGVEFRYVIKEIVCLIVEGVALLLLSWKLFKTRLE
ncbi:MAG: ABC transporter permease [Bacteroidaceae bacterium]|nr:ABC transporter permease [Bacteroidaceae bacterium]MBQ8867307.1 ABC transporter permease [Bacteroidaceae bacterium]